MLKLLLHIIDIGVCCDAILRIFVSEVDLMTETLAELLANLIRDVIIGHHRNGRILHQLLSILCALQHQLVLLKHTVFVLVDFCLNRFILVRLQVVVIGEEGSI